MLHLGRGLYPIRCGGKHCNFSVNWDVEAGAGIEKKVVHRIA
jgi:hypothetical protein